MHMTINYNIFKSEIFNIEIIFSRYFKRDSNFM